jgi:RNA polymerase sigma factor (sigma-70 family)
MRATRDPAPDPAGPGDPFPTTCWSRILSATARDRKYALESLARAYERPIREWLRCRLGFSADVEDAAQDFFLWVLATNLFGKADPARGRFRAFLKTALRHFVIDRERRRRRKRDGGGRAPLSIHDEEGELLPLASPAASSDAALDEAWRAALIERVTARLEAELRDRGKETYFLVFRDYFLDSGAELDHRAVAERHGIRVGDVSNYLRVAKARFRALLRAAVLETVGGAEELCEELRWLFEEERR